MEAICIRSCTVPGLGLVEKGRKVDIPEGPWEKHFDVQKAPEAEPKTEPKPEVKTKAKAKKSEAKEDDFLDI